MSARSHLHKPNRPATISQEHAPTPFLLPVRMENMTVETWLLQVAAYRPQLPIEDRYEVLLWSWPIRRAIASLSPNPLWTCKDDDKETLDRKAAVLTRLESLERRWYPYRSLSKINEFHDVDFTKLCRDICGQLRELPDVPVPDPDNDPLWLARLIETRWGDGRYDYRRDAQYEIMVRLNPAMRQQVCEIGERARDAAYRSVQTTRLLDELRHTKKSMESFISWLGKAKNHMPFVEGQIPSDAELNISSLEWLYSEDLAAFSAAFQVVTAKQKRVTDYLEHTFDSLRKDAGRDRRTKAGKPSCPWVARATQAMMDLRVKPEDLRLKQEDRSELLSAWSLKPLA